jgi:Ca-activated chloride channel homolog
MRVSIIGLSVVPIMAIVPLLIQESTSIRLNVTLVQLHVRVTDPSGHAVAGLPKGAFRLFVDNVLKEITVFQSEDAPVTAGIVLDNSASMAPKREDVIGAALAFARASNPKDQMFVLHFNNMVRFTLPKSARFTGDVSELETAIDAFQLGGTTAFYDALVQAEAHFKFAGYARRVLLSITDGGDNSSRASLDDALNGARSGAIVIYPIGVFDQNDRDQNPAVLKTIAEQTGGEARFPKQVSETEAVCVEIARDIREQYTIGFPGAEDGEYHSIKLTVSDPNHGALQIHTRSGYRAGPPGSTGHK